MKLRFLLYLIISIVLSATSTATDLCRMTYTRLNASDGLSDNQVQHILQLPDGRMIFTTRGNINLYDGKQFRYIHQQEGSVYKLKGYAGAYHVYIGHDDLLWVKDWNKLWCLDLRHERYVNQLENLFLKMGIQEEVTDIFADHQKDLWVITSKGVWDAQRHCYLRLQPTVHQNSLLDIIRQDHQLLLFYDTGEVIIYDIQKDKILHTVAKPVKEYKRLFGGMSLAINGDQNHIYQVCNGEMAAVFEFNLQTREWTQLLLTPYTLHTIIVTPDKQAYVTCGKGIWHIDLAARKNIYHPSVITDEGQLLTTDINTIYQDRQQGIWLGTYNQGLLYAHPARQRFHSATSLKELGLRDLQENTSSKTLHEQTQNPLTDSRGWIWTKTCDGLKLYQPETKTSRIFYTENGLSNNFIHAIIEDHKGRIWVSTSHGISRLEHNKQNNKFRLDSYNQNDGTLKEEYLDNKAFRLPDGRILMQGIEGWTVFHPDSADLKKECFMPLLAGISVHGRPLTIITDSSEASPSLNEAVPYTDHVELEWTDNTLSFRFSALNYASPEQTYYRYRLIHDADSVWQTARHYPGESLVDEQGMLHLGFVQLASGKYRLQVMASTHPEHWKGPIKEISILIHAPWWKTPWAYAGYIIVALLALSGAFGIYYRTSRQRMQQQHKEEILILRIRSLIERCNQYEQQAVCPAIPSEEADNNDFSEADNIFLNKAVAMVEQHLNTPGYSVEQLSKDLCMERSGLYKKLTALLDKSPSLFIRSIRLKRAADLIIEGRMTMAEIAEHVGFSSSSYMSKCFVEEFGCKPSEYARQNSRKSIQQDNHVE